ncbi:unnamed protein product, partial [Enterobius vermicularis]|uniref:DUF1311 domain-containing protein n=1 Tax=Enterobius vermicularis TaxID=51028 RepID=A0A0N4UUC4_ENTVE
TLQFEIRKEQQAINSFRELDEWCNYANDSFKETAMEYEFADRLAAKHSKSRLKEYEQIAYENFPRLRPKVNYIHVAESQMVKGYFGFYCATKAIELRLQNVKGNVCRISIIEY